MQADRQAKGGEVQQLGTIYCLAGCTAVGKTELSLQWAERYGAEIVNCDSLLFYRGMDIGTAKPSREERSRVPHHLIDICESSEKMDVGRFVELAVEAICDIQSRGRKALVTGGSGFYLKAFFEPVVDAARISDEVRALVSDWMEKGLAEAVSELRRRNPEGLDGLDVDNPRRVSKALERCLATGKTIVELKAEFEELSNPLVEAPKRLCILERDKEELNERISRRVASMLEAGLLEEVERLLEAGIEKNPSACNAIGYRESIAYLRGECDRETLLEKIVANTRRLAKKQRTWFRGQMPQSAVRLNMSEGREIELSEIFEASTRQGR